MGTGKLKCHRFLTTSQGSKLCTTFLKIAKRYKTVGVGLRLIFQFTYVQYCNCFFKFLFRAEASYHQNIFRDVFHRFYILFTQRRLFCQILDKIQNLSFDSDCKIRSRLKTFKNVICTCIIIDTSLSKVSNFYRGCQWKISLSLKFVGFDWNVLSGYKKR